MNNTEKTTKTKKKRRLTWRSWHKWAGVIFAIFIILFSISGIILNHRHLFSHCEVSRWWLPSAYHIHDWNQGVIKGTIPYNNKIIAYGLGGVWLTDRQFKTWEELNDGIAEGIDNRKISNVIQTSDGTLWCAALWDVYKREIKWKGESGKWRVESGKWEKVTLPGNDERISDITMRDDGMVVVATRSALYYGTPNSKIKRFNLKNPQGVKGEVTLFKTVWMLHSGQMFGLAGAIVVDIIAVVLIILCLTGIVFFILRYSKKVPQRAETMRWNLRWHNRLGSWLIILTTIVAVTGMCLRPPLMIPLAMTKTAPVPYSSMDSDNYFQDKIRAIRWDEKIGLWLMSTSEGFFAFKDSTVSPVSVTGAPGISPMGITVFERNPYNTNEWLIGSFSGLSRWNPMTGEVNDWFHDGTKQSRMPSIGGHNVTGFTMDYSPDGKSHDVVFQYAAAPLSTKPLTIAEMPEELKSQPMSLWNFALELHVGRCYEPFLGSIISVLFVFISGLLLTLILISGYIVYKRGRRKKNIERSKTKQTI